MGSNLQQPSQASGAQIGTDPNQAAWSQDQQDSALLGPTPQAPTAAPNTPLTRTTQYGWATDNPSDTNTTVLKIGNHDNPLTPHAAALSDAEAKNLNAKPGDVIQVGNKAYYYADRAPENDARVDLYQPQGMDNSIPDYQAIKNLGGGSSNLKGQALADAGEQGVQRLMQQSAGVVIPQAPVTAQPVTTPSASVNSAPNESTKNTTDLPDPQNGIAFLNLLKGLNLQRISTT